MKRFTKINMPNAPGSEQRLPRLGKIRLGVVARTQAGKEYPRETDYFVCPPEVQEVYGERPKELDVVFPVEAEEMVFPHFLGAYGANHKLVCHGDGQQAERYDKESGEWVDRQCPCDWYGKQCSRRSNLMVVLPKISCGGVFQIDSGSYVSMDNVLNYIAWLRGMFRGRISWIPMKLIRYEQAIRDPNTGKAQKHWPIKLVCDIEPKELTNITPPQQQLEVEEPVIDGPLADTPYVDEEEFASDRRNSKLVDMAERMRQQAPKEESQQTEETQPEQPKERASGDDEEALF